MKSKKKFTIKDAIIRLKQEYERAKGLSFVRNPLAYALYKVWKEADRQEERHEQTELKESEEQRCIS